MPAAKFKSEQYIRLEKPIEFRFNRKSGLPGGQITFLDYDSYHDVLKYEKIYNDKIDYGWYQEGKSISFGQYQYTARVKDDKIYVFQL